MASSIVPLSRGKVTGTGNRAGSGIAVLPMTRSVVVVHGEGAGHDHVEGPLVFDDEGMVIDAALAGLGLAYLFEYQVASLLQAGALARVLEDWCLPFPGFFLYYPRRRQASPALAAFIDAIRVPTKARKSH